MRLNLPLLSLCLILHSAHTFAQQTSLQQSLLTGSKQRGWKVSSSLMASSNLRSQDSQDSQSELAWSLSPQVQLTSDIALRASASGTQQMGQERKSTLNNTKLSLRHSLISISDNVLLLPQLSALAPTNSDLRDGQSYQGGVAVESSLITNFKIMKQNFDMIYSASLGQSFHQFVRARSGESNTEYTLAQSITLESLLGKNWSIALTGEYIAARTYSQRIRNTYALTEELTYQLDKISWISIGHTYGANVLGPDGTSQDVRFFGSRDSILFSSLSISI